MADPVDGIEITEAPPEEEPKPEPKGRGVSELADALARVRLSAAHAERDKLQAERDHLKAEADARAKADAEVKAERQRAVRHEIFKRFERLPENVRAALGAEPTPREMAAAVAAHGAARPAHATPARAAPGLAPPPGLTGSPRRPTPADLAGMTYSERQQVYREVGMGDLTRQAVAALVDTLRPLEAVDRLAQEGVRVGPTCATTR
jgi:hypothetical protein